jgi:asparagine synthase (glutamine-hydrolysing)
VSLFLVLVPRNGCLITPGIQRRYETARCCRGLRLQWVQWGPAALLLGLNGAGPQPVVASWHSHIGVGLVRLDNGPELARALGCEYPGTSDMELVVRTTARHGEAAVPNMLGDFAFVIWDRQQEMAIVGRDAFGVKKLYYSEDLSWFGFSSRAELLGREGEYEVETLAQLAAGCSRSPQHTVYKGVHCFPPGSAGKVQQDGLITGRFWFPERFEPRSVSERADSESCEAFRHLFTESVRRSLTGHSDVWAQLSGGLDSSSVVSTAQWLAQGGIVPRGVAGTVSWVYRWSRDGDEREYSDAVIRRFGVRNEPIDVVFWEDDSAAPPLTDEPDPEYAGWVREMRTCRVVREAGGKILLTGFGSDHYLLGNMFFFADWLARGHGIKAALEMLHRAALARASFWELAFQNAVLPQLPNRVRRWLMPQASVPSWIPRAAVRKYGLEQTADADGYSGPIGAKYFGYQLANINSIAAGLGRHAVLEEELDVRHPFLYRPLVEFGLSLPPEMVVRPHARKWILREALRGILPDSVRSRVGKGGNTGCTVRSLMQQRPKLERMLQDSRLADLGCIDVSKLRLAYDVACRTHAEHLIYSVAWTLAVETWLQARVGREHTGARQAG